MITPETIARLTLRGWQLTRDGSTGTAQLVWEDPDDRDSGFVLMVLHTAGHGCRFTLEPFGSGLSERMDSDAALLQESLSDARLLLRDWQGELPDEQQ